MKLLWRLFNMKHGGKRYLKTYPEGWVCVVKEFGPFWKELDWDRFPIERLQDLEHAGGFFLVVHYYQFNSWKTLRKVIKEIGAAQFLYGKMTFQLGVGK